MAKIGISEKEDISTKIVVDTIGIDEAIEKVDRLYNALNEVQKLMSDVFSQKAASKEANQDDDSLKITLFFEALACEKLNDKAMSDYLKCFDSEGNPLANGGLIKKREIRSIREEAKSELLREFFKSYGI